MNKLPEIYKKIPFNNFILHHRNNEHYGLQAIMWLDLVLDLIGETSYRDKERFLHSLLKHKKLNSFLKHIGIDKKLTKSPGKSIFGYYKKNVDFIKFQDFCAKTLTNKFSEIDTSSIIKKYKIEDEFIHLAIDGKDIRNTKTTTVNGKTTNIKTINYVTNGHIIDTKIASSEQTYIKNNLSKDLPEIARKIKIKSKKK